MKKDKFRMTRAIQYVGHIKGRLAQPLLFVSLVTNHVMYMIGS